MDSVEKRTAGSIEEYKKKRRRGTKKEIYRKGKNSCETSTSYLDFDKRSRFSKV